MLEVRVQQGRNRGQAGSAGKSHGAVFCKHELPVSCSVPTKHQLGCREGQTSLSSGCQLSASGKHTHTLPAPLQLPGTLLHVKTLHTQICAELTSNPEISFSEFYAPA